MCVCVCVCGDVCVCVMQYQSHSPLSCKDMTGRESQIPTGHLEHSPCRKVCASDAVQSVDNTAAHPNDPKRQTEGRVVVVVCVCVCVCVCVTTASTDCALLPHVPSALRWLATRN